MNTTTLWIAGALMLACQDARGQSTPAVDPTLELARSKYKPEEWPMGERRDGFVLEDVELPGLVGGPTEFAGGEVQRTFADAQGKERLLVEMTVYDQVADAHAALLRHVAYVQSTKTLATTASKGFRAGDVGYVAMGGKAGDKLAWIAFVFGNVEFRVLNLEPDAAGAADLKSAVERIAARIAAAPKLADSQHVSAPVVKSFSAERSSFPAGTVVLLDLAADDPTGRAPRFDFVVGSPGQGYVEQDEQGRWRFHSTGPGRSTLTLLVLGRNGVTATKPLDVVIE
jgi:hypothetical protein